MIVRIEDVRNSSQVLVISELDKYLGYLEDVEFFLECTNVKLEPIEEDGYVYFHVDKNCLKKYLKL